jgi:SsrA-binding protein
MSEGDRRPRGRGRDQPPGAVPLQLLETWEVGIALQGSEVKSVRDGKVTLKDSYAFVRDGEVWLHNMHIAPYAPAAREGHDPERPRKLLMHRREIERLIGKTKEKGLTLVPTRMYFSGRARRSSCAGAARSSTTSATRSGRASSARHGAGAQTAPLSPVRPRRPGRMFRRLSMAPTGAAAPDDVDCMWPKSSHGGGRRWSVRGSSRRRRWRAHSTSRPQMLPAVGRGASRSCSGGARLITRIAAIGASQRRAGRVGYRALLERAGDRLPPSTAPRTLVLRQPEIESIWAAPSSGSRPAGLVRAHPTTCDQALAPEERSSATGESLDSSTG